MALPNEFDTINDIDSDSESKESFGTTNPPSFTSSPEDLNATSFNFDDLKVDANSTSFQLPTAQVKREPEAQPRSITNIIDDLLRQPIRPFTRKPRTFQEQNRAWKKITTKRKHTVQDRIREQQSALRNLEKDHAQTNVTILNKLNDLAARQYPASFQEFMKDKDAQAKAEWVNLRAVFSTIPRTSVSNVSAETITTLLDKPIGKQLIQSASALQGYLVANELDEFVTRKGNVRNPNDNVVTTDPSSIEEMAAESFDVMFVQPWRAAQDNIQIQNDAFAAVQIALKELAAQYETSNQNMEEAAANGLLTSSRRDKHSVIRSQFRKITMKMQKLGIDKKNLATIASTIQTSLVIALRNLYFNQLYDIYNARARMIEDEMDAQKRVGDELNKTQIEKITVQRKRTEENIALTRAAADEQEELESRLFEFIRDYEEEQQEAQTILTDFIDSVSLDSNTAPLFASAQGILPMNTPIPGTNGCAINNAQGKTLTAEQQFVGSLMGIENTSQLGLIAQWGTGSGKTAMAVSAMLQRWAWIEQQDPLKRISPDTKLCVILVPNVGAFDMWEQTIRDFAPSVSLPLSYIQKQDMVDDIMLPSNGRLYHIQTPRTGGVMAVYMHAFDSLPFIPEFVLRVYVPSGYGDIGDTWRTASRAVTKAANTLVIVDEAHQLVTPIHNGITMPINFSAAYSSPISQPEWQYLRWLMRCNMRLLLLTATPGMYGLFSLVMLLDLVSNDRYANNPRFHTPEQLRDIQKQLDTLAIVNAARDASQMVQDIAIIEDTSSTALRNARMKEWNTVVRDAYCYLLQLDGTGSCGPLLRRLNNAMSNALQTGVDIVTISPDFWSQVESSPMLRVFADPPTEFFDRLLAAAKERIAKEPNGLNIMDTLLDRYTHAMSVFTLARNTSLFPTMTTQCLDDNSKAAYDPDAIGDYICSYTWDNGVVREEKIDDFSDTQLVARAERKYGAMQHIPFRVQLTKKESATYNSLMTSARVDRCTEFTLQEPACAEATASFLQNEPLFDSMSSALETLLRKLLGREDGEIPQVPPYGKIFIATAHSNRVQAIEKVAKTIGLDPINVDEYTGKTQWFPEDSEFDSVNAEDINGPVLKQFARIVHAYDPITINSGQIAIAQVSADQSIQFDVLHRNHYFILILLSNDPDFIDETKKSEAEAVGRAIIRYLQGYRVIDNQLESPTEETVTSGAVLAFASSTKDADKLKMLPFMLAAFNDPLNNDGHLIPIFIGDANLRESVTLKTVRVAVALETSQSLGDKTQLVGRMVRMCSNTNPDPGQWLVRFIVMIPLLHRGTSVEELLYHAAGANPIVSITGEIAETALDTFIHSPKTKVENLDAEEIRMGPYNLHMEAILQRILSLESSQMWDPEWYVVPKRVREAYVSAPDTVQRLISTIAPQLLNAFEETNVTRVLPSLLDPRNASFGFEIPLGIVEKMTNEQRAQFAVLISNARTAFLNANKTVDQDRMEIAGKAFFKRSTAIPAQRDQYSIVLDQTLRSSVSSAVQGETTQITRTSTLASEARESIVQLAPYNAPPVDWIARLRVWKDETPELFTFITNDIIAQAVQNASVKVNASFEVNAFTLQSNDPDWYARGKMMLLSNLLAQPRENVELNKITLAFNGMDNIIQKLAQPFSRHAYRERLFETGNTRYNERTAREHVEQVVAELTTNSF